MRLNVLNTILLGIICFLVLVTLLIDISINISWSASITDWLSVIIYTVTLGVAVCAACTAKKALKENQEITKIHTEPFITIKIDHMNESINWFRLKVSNEGLGQAFNIQLEITNNNKEKYRELSNKILARIRSPNFMVKGLKHLSPSESKFSNFFSVDIVTGQEQQNIDMFFNLNFNVKVTYQDKNEINFERKYILDFSEYKDVTRISTKTVHENQLEEFKKLNKAIMGLKLEHSSFKNEYEKSHRDWTETELRRKVAEIDSKRRMYKQLNKEYPEDIIIAKRQLSIHQLRKQNK